jgi:protein ImuA
MSPTAQLTALRARIRQIEQPARHGVLPFGVAAIDAALPGGGLSLGAVHEIFGTAGDEEDAAAPAGFAASILARTTLSRIAGEGLQKNFRASDPHPPLAIASGPPSPALRERVTGIVLWCLKQPDLYGPGLREYGLDPARLTLVTAKRDAELLWAVEEALQPGSGVGAVIGEIGRLPMIAGRRLQLAAERSGITAFLLRRWRSAAEAAAERERPSPAVTRWRVTSVPSPPGVRGTGAGRKSVGRSRWRVELLRCRGGMPGNWEVEVADAAGFISVSAGLADRPAARSRPALPETAPLRRTG